MNTRFTVLSHEALVNELLRILSRQLGADVAASTDLIDRGLLDSVGVVRLLVEVEERLGVSLPMSELDIDDLRSATALARTIAGGVALQTRKPRHRDQVVEALSKP